MLAPLFLLLNNVWKWNDGGRMMLIDAEKKLFETFDKMFA
jgi:hypothetical protein